jgi:hypothetical protein
MGCCLSRCIPDSDMATELEAELEESSKSYIPHESSSTFGTTSLLAVCFYMILLQYAMHIILIILCRLKRLFVSV